jgi:hypothetical protein
LEVDEGIVNFAVETVRDHITDLYRMIVGLRGEAVKLAASSAADVCRPDNSFDVEDVLAHVQQVNGGRLTRAGCDAALQELAADCVVTKRGDHTWAFTSETARSALRAWKRYAT